MLDAKNECHCNRCGSRIDVGNWEFNADSMMMTIGSSGQMSKRLGIDEIKKVSFIMNITAQKALISVGGISSAYHLCYGCYTDFLGHIGSFLKEKINTDE